MPSFMLGDKLLELSLGEEERAPPSNIPDLFVFVNDRIDDSIKCLSRTSASCCGLRDEKSYNVPQPRI